MTLINIVCANFLNDSFNFSPRTIDFAIPCDMPPIPILIVSVIILTPVSFLDIFSISWLTLSIGSIVLTKLTFSFLTSSVPLATASGILLMFWFNPFFPNKKS